MKNMFTNSKKVFITLSLSTCLLCSLVGCGDSQENNEMKTFQQDMNTFYTHISEKNEKINALDPEDENSTEELLTLLDEVSAEFEWLDQISVPEKYGAVDQMANEGKQYMVEAVRLYRLALEGDPNYENILVAAKENYRRANLRIQYINDILEGKEPEIE